MNKSLNRLFEKFSEDEQIENTFKFIIWLSVTGLVASAAAILFRAGDYGTSVIMLVLEVVLFFQIASFSFKNIMLPFISALMPDTDYVKSNQLFLKLPIEKRRGLFIKLLLTPQSLFFLVCYFGLYYIMYKVFMALVVQRYIT